MDNYHCPNCDKTHLTPNSEDWLPCCFPPVWLNVDGWSYFNVWQGSGCGSGTGGLDGSGGSSNCCCDRGSSSGGCGGWLTHTNSDGGGGGDGRGRHTMKESGADSWYGAFL